MPYASIVPAIRTVHGVDVFDYKITEGTVLVPGDIIRVPFRKKLIEGMVVSLSETSPVASKAVDIGSPEPLLRAGQAGADLLASAADRCFSPRPSVLASWLRGVPKRATGLPLVSDRTQPGLPLRETRYAIDRIAETKRLAATTPGSMLVLVPWQERAEQVAAALDVTYLHADLAAGGAWKAVQKFTTGENRILVTTRIGAWLSLFADAVVIDEPENDDHKQDEMTPRLDARWIAQRAAQLRPGLSLVSVATTPAVAWTEVDWAKVPTLEPVLASEARQGRSRSKVDGLTASTLTRLEQDHTDGRPIFILHPIRGERARFTCRDCGWIATCKNCGFALSRISNGAVCRKCGKRSPAPSECIKCGGVDLSRSVGGTDRLIQQLKEFLPTAKVVSLTEFWHTQMPTGASLAVTDIALIGGAVEDIRRRERLAISVRRVAAMCQAAGVSLILQGDEHLLAQCGPWLSSSGLHTAWDKEREERRLFGYPPSMRMAKLLVDGTTEQAEAFYASMSSDLPSEWMLSYPMPVPYRPAASSPRSCLQLSAPLELPEQVFVDFLRPYASSAIIDLDPIAFFS